MFAIFVLIKNVKLCTACDMQIAVWFIGWIGKL